MPTPSHKKAGSYITVISSAPAARLQAICEEVARATVGTGLNRAVKPEIRLTSRKPKSLHFAIGNRIKPTLMTFRVDTAETPQGTVLTSQIMAFQTKQDMFLGFIPSGPKQLGGWVFYKDFMQRLAEAISKFDRSADINIIEQAK
jgi:hypothetical protein